MGRGGRLLGAVLLALAVAGCGRRSRPSGVGAGEPDWDRVAFSLQLVRQEYPELVEAKDFSRVPALRRALDAARASLERAAGEQARLFAHDLADLSAELATHPPPRPTVARCRRILTALLGGGLIAPHPPAAPDLQRGAATYQSGCAPCHGPPRGPPPPSVATMVPQPPPAALGASTPYELYTRITYGGADTPMPAFADTVPGEVRWEIAFWLFAARWPACEGKYTTLSAAEQSLLSDRDLWDRAGYGAAACQRRTFRR